MNKNGRRRFFKFFPLRLVSAFVLTTFISTNQFAAPALAVPAAPAIINEILPTDAAAIKVPQEIGNIQEVFKGNQNEMVLLIQDAHAVPDAQRSIQELIHYFQKQYGVGLIALEGAVSKLDAQIFRSFPDKELLKKVFQEYQLRGELAGGAAASIFNEAPGIYHGIEDWDLYEEGIRLYQEALSKEQELTSLLTSIESNLLDQSKTLFSPNTQKLQDKRTSFQKNEIDLIEYVKSLKDLFEKTTRDSIAAPFKVGARHAVPLQRGALSIEKNTFRTFSNTYPELHKILEVEGRGVLQYAPTFDAAQTQLIQTFKETLLPKDKQIEMNQMIQLHNIGHLSQGMLVKRIEDLSREFNFTFRTPEVLKPAAHHARTLESFHVGARHAVPLLFSELESLEARLRETLPQTGEERALLKDFHHLELLKRLAKLELTRQEWNKLKQWKQETGNKKQKEGDSKPASCFLLPASAPCFLLPDSSFSSHFRFYRLASQRDTVLFNNLLKFLNRNTRRHLTPDTCLTAQF